MDERLPAEVFPPGEFLRDELEARGWTQVEFAEIIGKPARLINEIIGGKRSITPETANIFAAALGTSAQLWMNLESAYQLSRVTPAAETIAIHAKLREKFPVREMMKRGWLEPSTNIDVIESQVLSFFEITSIDDEPKFAHAARRTHDKEISPIQLAWLYRVRQMAKSIGAPKYSELKLRKALSELEKLLIAPEEARNVPRILAECGVRFIIVEPMSQSKIDGVCFWLDNNSPVIGMSLRYDRIDNFWFVLRHEIEHVLCRHGMDEGIVDIDVGEHDSEDESTVSDESAADRAASNFCAPNDKFESFMIRKRPFYYEKDVVAFSQVVNRHPGLIVGKMQHKLNNYAYLKKYLVKIRQFILPGAITDGWGQTSLVNC